MLAWAALGFEGDCHDPRRLLDPVVLANTTANASVSATFSSSFAAAWTAAEGQFEARRVNLLNFTQFATLSSESLTAGAGDVTVWPNGARVCADHDNCVGVTDGRGDCVCYQ